MGAKTKLGSNDFDIMISWLILCAVCCLVYWLISVVGTVPSWRTIRIFNKLQGPTDQPFFIGASWDFMRMNVEDVIPCLKKQLDKFGGWYAVYGMGQPWLMVTDPDVIAVILKDKDNTNKGPEYRLLHRILDDGLITSTGEKWRQRRKILMPSFQFAILHDSLPCMNRNWKEVVNEMLGCKGSLEPMTYIKKGTLNIINETAMGIILDDNDGSCKKYLEAGRRVLWFTSKRATTLWMRNDFLFDLSSFSKPYMNDIKILNDFIKKVIQERKAAFTEKKRLEELQYSERDGTKQQAFLDSLLELSTKEHLSDSDIHEEVHTFMFAGHHTTSLACEYLMLHLAENLEVQERAYQEQLEIFGYSDRDVTKDDLSKMHYLDLVIKETLRLHPSVPQFARHLIKDIKLPNGQLVPAGTKVTIHLFLAHRNPKYWKDPEAFKPERFSLEESKDRHPFSYVPFSAGPRNCIGMSLAKLELKVFASILLRSCKLSAVTRSEDLKYKIMISLEQSTPIKVEVSPRNQYLDTN